ncbi:MAG: hypothetical protein M9885_04450 [Burkholderiaceae bacterium]|nr:hypothetical protein [Burkholderiaceae bacterium]
MAFALRIDSAPRALQRRLPALLAVFALAATLFAIAFADPSRRGALVLASLACFAFALARCRRTKRAGLLEGSLSIDEEGRAAWVDAFRTVAGEARPVRIERWNMLGPLAWLRLRFEGDPVAADVMFARGDRGGGGAAAAERGENEWRRLRAWLLWYGRGAMPAGSSGAARVRR